MIKELINKYKENKKENERIDKIIEELDRLKWETTDEKTILEKLIDKYYSKYEINKKQIVNNDEYNEKSLQEIRQQIKDCLIEIERKRICANNFYKVHQEDIETYNKRFDNSLDKYIYQKQLTTETGTQHLEQYVLNNYIKK